MTLASVEVSQLMDLSTPKPKGLLTTMFCVGRTSVCLSLLPLGAPVPGQLVLEVGPPSHMADPRAVGLKRVEGSGAQAATGGVSDSSQEPDPLLPAQKAPTGVVLQQESVRYQPLRARACVCVRVRVRESR